MSGNLVLFEPWGLGDAAIAGSILCLDHSRFSLACSPRWIDILRVAIPESNPQSFIGVDLNYSSREGATGQGPGVLPNLSGKTLVSIRGDPRDYFAARHLFPGANLKFSGWSSFAIRKVKFLEWIAVSCGRRPKNRYRAWTDFLGLDFEKLKSCLVPEPGPGQRIVGIHIGAQWRSRQYPFVGPLRELLMSRGYKVRMMAGPKDIPPSGLNETLLERLQGTDLIQAIRGCDAMITNDSGPMHLAGLLRRPVLAIARVSNITEWIPPHGKAICSPKMPQGYSPDSRYSTDEVLDDWPDPATVVKGLES
jgi:hypothetical protein